MSAVIAEFTDPVWQSLDPDDTAATERVLNAVLEDLRNKLELEFLVVANKHPLRSPDVVGIASGVAVAAGAHARSLRRR